MLTMTEQPLCSIGSLQFSEVQKILIFLTIFSKDVVNAYALIILRQGRGTKNNAALRIYYENS